MQLQKHLIFASLDITQNPRWLDDNSDQFEGRIGFAFTDPDGSIAAQFEASPIFLMNKQCCTRVLEDQVIVHQCNRCYKYGPQHIDCDVRCRYCGRAHPSNAHQKFCHKCAEEGLEATGIECPHLECFQCKIPNQPAKCHTADHEKCPVRTKMIGLVRKQNGERARLQINVMRSALSQQCTGGRHGTHTQHQAYATRMASSHDHPNDW